VRLALKSRESLVKAWKNLEACTGLRTQEPPSETVIRKKVLALFDEWLGKSGGSLLPVPEGKGIWTRIIDDALWRNPPFECAADDEEKSSEKGFRDALICETVVAYAGQERPEQVVFIVKDNLLRAAAANRGMNAKLLIFDTIGAFTSHVELLQQNQTAEYSQEIIKAAGASYYTDGNQECLYYSFDIDNEIPKQFSIFLDHPSLKADPRVSSSILTPQVGKLLVPISDEQFFQGETILSEVKDQRLFWVTNQKVVRLFSERYATTATPLSLFPPVERIRIANVAVHWSSEFGLEPKITSPKLEKLEWGGYELEFADALKKIRYGFFSNSA
jgi:hypothetical protein